MQVAPVDHAPIRNVLERVEMAGVGLIVPNVERVVIHDAPTYSTLKEATAGGVVTLFGRLMTSSLAGFYPSVLNAIALRASGFPPWHHGLVALHLHRQNIGDDMTNREALRLADLLETGAIWQDQEAAAAELRRLYYENQYLEDEIIEQSCINGMSGQREVRLRTINSQLTRALKQIVDHWGDPMPLTSTDKQVLHKWIAEYQTLKMIASKALAKAEEKIEA